MRLSELGEIAEECWNAIPEHHPFVDLDAHVIMPDHLHGILVLKTAQNLRPALPKRRGLPGVRVDPIPPDCSTRSDFFSSISPKKQSLSVVLRTFKASVTTNARKFGYNDFAWQPRFSRSYHQKRNPIVSHPAVYRKQSPELDNRKTNSPVAMVMNRGLTPDCY